MILQLLESRRARRLAVGALAASVAVHALTVGAAARERAPGDDISANEGPISIRYLLPRDRVEAPRGERIQWVAMGEGSTGLDDGAAPAVPDERAGARDTRLATRDPEPEPVGVEEPEPTTLYTAEEVDTAVSRDPSSEGPLYPDELRTRGVQGEVIVEFTVDTSGRADVASFAVVESTHPLFAQAVRDALPKMLFTPAVTHGRRVRQLVRLPMKFRLMTEERGTA